MQPVKSSNTPLTSSKVDQMLTMKPDFVEGRFGSTARPRTPETQRSRFRQHRDRLAALGKQDQPVKQFFASLRIFLLDCWLDIVTILIIIAVAAGVWVAPHTFERLFPITFFDGSNDIVYANLAYPYTDSILSPVSAGLVAGLVPLACILLAQLWLRSTFDCGNAILGLAYSLSAGCLFQVVLKKTIGGLRPHFLTVCQPVIPDGLVGVGYQGIMFTADQVCTGDRDKIDNALESFPSGHSQIAWSGLGYLTIYLFTHLRILGKTRRPSHWKMCATLAPVLLATYQASTLVLSYHHHAYDVIFGSLIGMVTALFGYRMVFMAIWDPRTNWVPSRRWKQEKKEDERVKGDLEMGKRGSDVTMMDERPGVAGPSEGVGARTPLESPKGGVRA